MSSLLRWVSWSLRRTNFEVQSLLLNEQQSRSETVRIAVVSYNWRQINACYANNTHQTWRNDSVHDASPVSIERSNGEWQVDNSTIKSKQSHTFLSVLTNMCFDMFIHIFNYYMRRLNITSEPAFSIQIWHGTVLMSWSLPYSLKTWREMIFFVEMQRHSCLQNNKSFRFVILNR